MPLSSFGIKVLADARQREFEVIVPNRRTVAAVVADGQNARYLSEYFTSGFRVQTWTAMLREEPSEVVILFEH